MHVHVCILLKISGIENGFCSYVHVHVHVLYLSYTKKKC